MASLQPLGPVTLSQTLEEERKKKEKFRHPSRSVGAEGIVGSVPQISLSFLAYRVHVAYCVFVYLGTYYTGN